MMCYFISKSEYKMPNKFSFLSVTIIRDRSGHMFGKSSFFYESKTDTCLAG